MPSVKKAEFRTVWNSIHEIFEAETGVHLQTAETIPIFYEQLCDWLHRDSPYRCNPTYLYKELYSEKLTGKSETFPINYWFLQCIYFKYPKKKNGCVAYEDEFELIKTTKARKRGIEKIRQIKKQRDLSKPEFPPENPSYPASPHFPIHFENYKKLWIKNEAYNPTGTHKDRFAWEVVRYYSKKLAEHFESKSKLREPKLSIISSGSAAIAIQNLLNIYDLPAIKVLYDKSHLSQNIVDGMKSYGCELHAYELSKKELEADEVLAETKNSGGNGISLSPLSGLKEFEKLKFKFYDWLSIEILNQSPDYCIVPFGTGSLFENLLYLNKQYQTGDKDPRFFGNIKNLAKCQFIGATCKYSHRETLMDKLYSPYKTYKEFQWLDYKKYCSPRSRIEEVEENFVRRAIQFAEEQRIIGEPSGLSSLALFFQLHAAKKIDPNKKILIINTGQLKLGATQKEKKEKVEQKTKGEK